MVQVDSGGSAVSNGTPNGVTLQRVSSMPYTGEGGLGHTNGEARKESGMPRVPSGTQFEASYRRLSGRIRDRISSGDVFYSLEFFPPKTTNALPNFYQRVDRLVSGGAEFVDITWHLGSNPGSTTETSSSSVAGACLNYCLVDTMLHVTCAQYEKRQTIEHLHRAKGLGLRNILALRGDLPEPSNLSQYKYKAVDLVKWIREEFADYFTIAVAGYPSGHPDAESYTADLENLKEKCEAGADFIITQLFFEADVFIKFERDCREIGITVPIIPGIMPIQSYSNISRIASLSKLRIPTDIVELLEPLANDDDAVRRCGVKLAVDMCTRLLNEGVAPAFHMYTLNREASTREVLCELGLWQKSITRPLPWGSNCGHPTRCKEDVRPIFWSSRPKSYIFRTKDWDGYPNGRWGTSASPAFSEMTSYYLFYQRDKKPQDQRIKMWGEEIHSQEDVWKVFENYLAGVPNANGTKITRLPWSEVDLSPETSMLRDQLLWCNSKGICTLNSQPNVNCAPSTDRLVGWGKPGGYCFQKAYLEFFTSRLNADALLAVLPRYAARINYHIINRDGDLDLTNCEDNTPNAVTWGVFPGAEVAQPTVVDPISFHAWRDEAYELWHTQWATLYPDGSESRSVLDNMMGDYCLVNLVDNDFPQPTCLWLLLEDMLLEAEKTKLALSVGRSPQSSFSNGSDEKSDTT